MEGEKKKVSELAIVSLVLGIISYVTLLGLEKPIAAIIIGIIALKRLKKEEGGRGKGYALAGIILGIIAIVAVIVIAAIIWPGVKAAPTAVTK